MILRSVDGRRDVGEDAMSFADGDGPALTAVTMRTDEIVAALGGLSEQDLRAPSELDGWSRLTIACHLRYGAEALCRMTKEALAGRPTSFYPAGRSDQRPGTLAPWPGETVSDVLQSLATHSEELKRVWASAKSTDWDLTVREPRENSDLGPLALARLPLSRLTEVEVHGSDLGVHLKDWSDYFVETALPFRLDWLNVRRSNHRAVDDGVQGSWLLVATDGPTYLITVSGAAVRSIPSDTNSTASVVIEGSTRDLLAMLLGRPTLRPLKTSGDVALGSSFQRAFPGP
jgi:maleylpyruvate isomerase